MVLSSKWVWRNNLLFFFLKMPNFQPQPQRRKDRDFSFALPHPPVLPLHRVSLLPQEHWQRRMRTKAASSFSFFIFFFGSGLFSIYEKKTKKNKKQRYVRSSLLVNPFGRSPVVKATGCCRLTEQDVSIRAIFLGDQRRRVLQ